MKFFIYSIAFSFPATFHVISRNFSYLWDGIRVYGCLSLYHSQYIFFLLSLPCSISFSVSMKFFFSVTIVLLFLLYLSLALCLSHISVYISLFFPVSIILSVSVSHLSLSLFSSCALSHCLGYISLVLFLRLYFVLLLYPTLCFLKIFSHSAYCSYFCILNLHYQYVQYSCISKLYICTSKPAGMVLLKNTELFKENNVPNVPLY